MMKLKMFFACIFTVIMIDAPVFPQIKLSQPGEFFESKSEEGKLTIRDFLFSFKQNPVKQPLAEKDVYKILAGVSFAGFIFSVVVLNKDIFDAVPLTLLAAGIVFIYLGF